MNDQQANPHEAGYVKEVSWRAKCLCGWEGPPRPDSLAAHLDYDQHRSFPPTVAGALVVPPADRPGHRPFMDEDRP